MFVEHSTPCLLPPEGLGNALTGILAVIGIFAILAGLVCWWFTSTGLHLGRLLVARAYAARKAQTVHEYARKIQRDAYTEADQGISEQLTQAEALPEGWGSPRLSDGAATVGDVQHTEMLPADRA